VSNLTPQRDPTTPATHAWASGKVILFGEHSVVYGQPAIACALDRGLCVSLQERSSEDGSAPHAESLLSLKALDLIQTLKPDRSSEPIDQLLSVAWGVIQRASLQSSQGHPPLSLSPPSLVIEVSGPLPFKVGLGSSAALALALLRALSQYTQTPLSNAQLDRGALEIETLFHQTPSGLDHTVSMRGGVLRFERTSTGLSLQSISLQPIHITQPLPLLLSWVPREGGTADAIKCVRLQRDKTPHRVQEIFQQIGALTLAGERALKSGDVMEIGALLQKNHALLDRLQVSTPSIEALRQRYLDLDALGVKLTGAGLGGAVIGIFESESARDRAEVALHRLTIPTWGLTVSPR
jgi:mevalonate kinase